MKFKELQKRPAADLEKEMASLQLELMKFRAQAAAGSTGKETSRIRTIKRDIARIKTLKNKEVVGKR